MWLSVPRVIFVLVFASVVPAWATQPNIIIVLTDDLGWKDVGYNDSEVQTPTIDRLAASGVKLKRYYAQPTCSPTRTSLMTGQAAVRNGVYLPIDKNNLSGLPLDQKILPQYFKEAGYQTSLIGKWHLGHAYRKQLPTSRGFDHHYGHLTGGIGHWDHLHGGGLDWQRDGAALREEGYSTHLMTNEAIRQIEQRDRERSFFMYLSYAAPHLPNEAPAKTVGKYSSIVGENRRVHAAMVDEIDQGLAELVATLEREGIQDNTLLWFMSDNGGLLPGAFPPTLAGC